MVVHRALALAFLQVVAGAPGSCSAQDGGSGSCTSPLLEERAHPWPQARGLPGSSGTTNLTGPADLGKPWYSWFPGKTRFRSTVLCGPLVDDTMHLYVTSYESIHKLTIEGERVWEFRSFEILADCPSLVGGALVGTDVLGHVFAVSLETGQLLWAQRHAEYNSGDTAYVQSSEGVVVFEAEPDNSRVLAVNSSDGSWLWEFRPDVGVWNFMAMFPQDGTVIFQDQDARTYRLGLRDGKLLWKSGGTPDGGALPKTWSDGGCMLGSNGVVYSVSAKTNIIAHHPTSGGGVHAYRVRDGSLLWERHLLRPFFTWPAVGRLAGTSNLSVIVAVGSNGYFAWKSILFDATFTTFRMLLLALGVGVLCLCRRGCGQRCCRQQGDVEQASGCRLAWTCPALLVLWMSWPVFATLMYVNGRSIFPIRTFEAEVYALDAETGRQDWEFRLPSWPHVSAAGDSEGFFERLVFSPRRTTCLPAAYSSPTIDATGTVYIGYHDGRVYGLKDANGDGIVTSESAGEVSSYDTKAAFLHSGPAFAPGMMAITNCDSLHVWRA